MEKKSEFEQAIEEHIENNQEEEVSKTEVNVENSQEEYEKFIRNPENRKRATILANQIVETVGKNWFTFDRFCLKLKLSKKEQQEDAFRQLMLLEGFGLCLSKIGGDDVPKNKKGKPVFKISMDYLAQIDLLDHDIAYHQARIEILKEQRQKIVERHKDVENEMAN